MRDILSELTDVLRLSSDSSIFRRWLSVHLRTDLGGTRYRELLGVYTNSVSPTHADEVQLALVYLGD